MRIIITTIALFAFGLGLFAQTPREGGVIYYGPKLRGARPPQRTGLPPGVTPVGDIPVTTTAPGGVPQIGRDVTSWRWNWVAATGSGESITTINPNGTVEIRTGADVQRGTWTRNGNEIWMDLGLGRQMGEHYLYKLLPSADGRSMSFSPSQSQGNYYVRSLTAANVDAPPAPLTAGPIGQGISTWRWNWVSTLGAGESIAQFFPDGIVTVTTGGQADRARWRFVNVEIWIDFGLGQQMGDHYYYKLALSGDGRSMRLSPSQSQGNYYVRSLTGVNIDGGAPLPGGGAVTSTSIAPAQPAGATIWQATVDVPQGQPYAGRYSATLTLTIANGQINGTGSWAHGPQCRLTGTLRGSQVEIFAECTDVRSIYRGVMSADGSRFDGTVENTSGNTSRGTMNVVRTGVTSMGTPAAPSSIVGAPAVGPVNTAPPPPAIPAGPGSAWQVTLVIPQGQPYPGLYTENVNLTFTGNQVTGNGVWAHGPTCNFTGARQGQSINLSAICTDVRSTFRGTLSPDGNAIGGTLQNTAGNNAQGTFVAVRQGAAPAGTDILGFWRGCDGRAVQFALENGTYVGRYTTLGGLAGWFQVNEVGYRHQLTGNGVYQGQDLWKLTDGRSEWRSSTITVRGNQFSDTGADSCSTTMNR